MLQRRPFLALAAVPLLATGCASHRPGTLLTRVETEAGAFVVAVHPQVAPVTVANYLKYVDGRHLDGGAVYRIVNLRNQPNSAHKIEVVQWGMHLQDESKRPFPTIRHETTTETGLRHRDMTVSMARAAPGTAGSEFFICIGDQPELDFGGKRNPDGQGFAAFGQVVEGQDVVRAIHRQGGDRQMLAKPIRVLAVRRVQ